ncbi:MAG: hypothetical protein N3G20_00620, partial [Verrucomicrobiae bacterium]|nr:hypothetical protein [Verrucomicrobiae bacterium]
HKAVKNLVPHNLNLWKKLRDGGIPVRTVTGKSTLFFHMPAIQFKELIRTCTRVCTLELRQAPKIVFTVMLAWIAGLALAPVCLLAAPDRLVGLFVYAVCALQVGWLAQQVGSYHWFAAMIYPVPLLFFLALSACSIAYRTKKKS